MIKVDAEQSKKLDSGVRELSDANGTSEENKAMKSIAARTPFLAASPVMMRCGGSWSHGGFWSPAVT